MLELLIAGAVIQMNGLTETKGGDEEAVGSILEYLHV